MRFASRTVLVVSCIGVLCSAGLLFAQTADTAVKQPMHKHHAAALSKDSTAKNTGAHKKVLAPQTTCPVMGNPIDKTLYVDYKGKRIYVCCAGCIDEVKKDPEKYIKKLADMGQSVEVIAPKKPVPQKKAE